MFMEYVYTKGICKDEYVVFIDQVDAILPCIVNCLLAMSSKLQENDSWLILAGYALGTKISLPNILNVTSITSDLIFCFSCKHTKYSTIRKSLSFIMSI